MKSNRQIFKLSLFGGLGFLLLAVLFSAFNYQVSNFNRFILSLTGEISVKEIKITETAEELEKDKKRIEALKKISIPTTKKSSGKTAAKAPAPPKKKHGDRTEPIRKGFYVESADKISDKTKLYLFKKDRVVYNQDQWTGARDVSAVCTVVRGKSGITATVDVVDDILLGESGTPWQNDSVEFYFDVRPKDKQGKDEYEKGVFQIIAVPCFSKTMPDRANFYAGGGKPVEIKGAKVKSEVIKNGYRLHLFLPYEGLKEAHYMPEKEFRFDFAVNDIDSTSKKTQIMWSGTSDNCRGPAWFGELGPAPEEPAK